MPVAVLGGGEGHTHAHLTHAPDLLSNGAHISGDTAFAQAGVERDDVDFVQLYDCFTIAVALQLEQLGFCAKGEGAAFAASGALAATAACRSTPTAACCRFTTAASIT